MDGIDLMVREHEHIMSLIGIMRKVCCTILEGEKVDEDDFRNMIFFARTYADRHHHGKEEDILFRKMTDASGPAAEKLIKHGMLVEHAMGRFYITELENALNRWRNTPDSGTKLDIITNAAGWGNVLTRHIEKENTVVYPFARRSLPPEILCTVDDEVQSFEIQAEKADVQNTGLRILQNLSEKYA